MFLVHSHGVQQGQGNTRLQPHTSIRDTQLTSAQKKKCDETRPQCARCIEHGQECVYEPVRPRQRRKRDSIATLSLKTDYSHDEDVDDSVAQTPRSALDDDFHRWPPERHAVVPWAGGQLTPLSAKSIDSTLDAILPWSPGGLHAVSPADHGDFDFSSLDGQPTQDDDDVEEVRRDSIYSSNTSITSHPTSHPTSHSQNAPSLALIAPIPTPSPRVEFLAPAFAEFSPLPNRRALVDHFCNVLSHLIVFREENGNPFQQLVLPLTHGSPAVMDAIYALASAHLEFRGVENGERSVWFHNKAIQGLARLIEQGGDVNKNELLAAIMLLVYYEVVSGLALVMFYPCQFD